MREISRDPFARTTLVRRTVRETHDIGRGCAWCGQPARYCYETHTDGGRVHREDQAFCSIGCRRSYHA